MFKLTLTLTTLACLTALAGCAAPGRHYGYDDYRYRNTVTGAAVGAAGGALLGHAADEDGDGDGALMGGALGAVVGGAAGYYLDRKNQHSPGSGYAPRYDDRDRRYPYYGR
jgi:hypothetical protein